MIKTISVSLYSTFTCFYFKRGKQQKLEFKKVRGRIGLRKVNIEDLIEKLMEAGYIKKGI